MSDGVSNAGNMDNVRPGMAFETGDVEDGGWAEGIRACVEAMTWRALVAVEIETLGRRCAR